MRANPDRFTDLLSADDAAAVSGASREVRIRPGDAVFLEGDRSERVIVIVQGLARVSASASSGDELLIAFRGPGDILGEQAALDGGHHGQTVRAVSEVVAHSILVDDFIGLLERRGISLALHRVHVGRLREADEMRLEQATVDVTGRIARCLDRLHTATGTSSLEISHRELASWVGASREAVTKGVAVLRRRGLIETTRSRIVLVDPDALHRVASSV